MKYLVIIFTLFLSLNLNAQNSIKGKVINSSNGEPLYLANIIVKGTANGTTSDKEGNFEITKNLDDNKTLLVSFLGFEIKEIKIADLSKNAVNLIELEGKLLSSQTVLVKGILGKKGSSPITFSKFDREEIKESHTIQSVPEFISYLPSTTFYTDAGGTTGPAYLNIRGFGQRRISVAFNGIPQNDPEDHNIYWHNISDLLENTELIQVQRGAGSGVIGYPSVGGSINIITSVFSDKPKFDLQTSLGSYNTRKYSASFSSGLIQNKYSIYVRMAQTLSSGYRDQSFVKFNSYHISAVRYDDKLTSQINIYGGPNEDGLVYQGLPKFAIKDKKLRKENFSYWSANEKTKEYTWTTRRRPEEVEVFNQPHFELLNEYKFNDNVVFNSALFLVLGNGYFDFDGSWADTSYLRLTTNNGFNPTQNPGNALIRATVENTQWGWIPRLGIKHKNGELIIGGEVRIHKSIHWSNINYAENLPVGYTKNFKSNYFEGGNNIFNIYANENYKVNDRLSILAEIQLASHNYKIEKERFVNNGFEISDIYLNPRFGLNYNLTNKISSYFAFARVTREPRLKNYYDAGESQSGALPQFERTSSGNFDFDSPLVKPEVMNSLELGSTYFDKKYTFNANLFYMLFNDEIVKKGQLDKFGSPITGNIDKTIHTGFEFSGAAKLNQNVEFILNGSYSKNYISEGVTYIDFNNSSVKLDLSDNKISGFPNLSFNAILKLKFDKLNFQAAAKYVGDFYSDNYDENITSYLNKYPGFISYSDNKVDAYFVTNLFASYETSFGESIKNARLFLQVNNLFDELYAANAEGADFFPAAERNILAGIKLGF